MKRIMNKVARGERGQALIIVLILMVVGGLIIAPLLSYMSSGLIVGRVYEKMADELYAADAGVEDATWQILAETDEVPEEGEPSWHYWLAGSADPDDAVNDKAVDIRITYIDPGELYAEAYKITSTATTEPGDSTTIVSYVSLVAGFRYLFDNAITSPGDVSIEANSTVTGDVQYNGDLYLGHDATIDGEEITEDIAIWPSAEDLIDFYSNDVHLGGATTVADGYEIDTSPGTEADPVLIPAINALGSVTITGNGWAQLTGTIYVTTDFTVKPNCHVMMSGQAIFSEDDIRWQPGSNLYGSGCIIAIDDLQFNPNMATDCDYIFLLCVEGNAQVKPNGDFCGSAAGDMVVEIDPNCTFIWVPYPDDLDFPIWDDPGGSGGSTGNVLRILTWEFS